MTDSQILDGCPKAFRELDGHYLSLPVKIWPSIITLSIDEPKEERDGCYACR